MKFPLIKIKCLQNDGSQFTRIVGTNSHDCLYVENNAIHYLDIQSVVSTQYPEESGFYFDGKYDPDYSFSDKPEIEFLTVEEVIELAMKNMIQQTESSIKLHKLIKKYFEEKERCKMLREKDGGIDTSGVLF